MARSAAQSDFVVDPAPPAGTGSAPHDPASGDGIEATPPTDARLRSSEASAFATRWVMGLTWLVLLALVLLCAIGPHIPSGE